MMLWVRRQFFLLMFLLIPVMASAQSIGSGDKAMIRNVIEGQMAAFLRDDAVKAFSYANPMIQRMFGTPDRFLSMVREGYAPVYRPSDVAFGALTPEDGKWIQAVSVIGPDGQLALALYTMEQQPDGSWLIAGCVLTKPPGAGA
jgi:hypothetical protein